jgi:hypothetical protein
MKKEGLRAERGGDFRPQFEAEQLKLCKIPRAVYSSGGGGPAIRAAPRTCRAACAAV